MGNANFTEDFKRDAVVQITERGYAFESLQHEVKPRHRICNGYRRCALSFPLRAPSHLQPPIGISLACNAIK